MPPKAFLSHSHVDSELVHAVASRVGRPFITIDSVEFRGGDDLLLAMEKAIRESAIFVLFASKASFESIWVRFEMDEARFHQALRRIHKTLVVLLDDRISARDFPAWMQRSLFMSSRSASPIARRIRALVDEVVQEEQESFFVGRSAEAAALQAALVPIDSTSSVSLVTVRGLPGIGRRTLISRVARDTLRIDTLLTLRVEAGDDVRAIAIKLADLVDPVATADDSIEAARAIEKLSDDLAVDRIITGVCGATALNELVVFYDAGGLLDNSGVPRKQMQPILQELNRQDDALALLVTNRRPYLRDLGDLADMTIVDVAPLQLDEVRQLLALNARAHGVELPSDSIVTLAEQVRGYPPSANALVQIVRSYGATLAAAGGQAHYQPRPLTLYLKNLSLDSVERRILRILASNSPLPIEVLIGSSRDEFQTVAALRALIDLSLVLPEQGTSWYRISEPVIDYVAREYPACTVSEYKSIADGLEKFLDQDQGSGQYLTLARVFYRALLKADRAARPRAYALVADWLRLAEEFYHARNYVKAREFALIADEANRSAETLAWVVKAHVRLGENDAALAAIDDLRRFGEVKEAHFLRGFLERHRSRHAEAIKHYVAAVKAGRGGLALERDLAECYLHVGKLDQAAEHIAAAQQRQPDNAYVIALRIKIACKRGDERTARDLLNQLHLVDDAIFANHHHSRVELQFGDVRDAYDYAKRAISASERPPFEALTNYALCQLRTGRTDDARGTLDQIVHLYGRQRADVQTGLQARLALAEQRYEDALGYCAKFEGTEKPAHLAIERDALRGLLDHTALSGDKRREMQSNVQRIEETLRSTRGAAYLELDPD